MYQVQEDQFPQTDRSPTTTKGRSKDHIRAEIEDEVDFYNSTPGKDYVVLNSYLKRQNRAGRDQRRMA